VFVLVLVFVLKLVLVSVLLCVHKHWKLRIVLQHTHECRSFDGAADDAMLRVCVCVCFVLGLSKCKAVNEPEMLRLRQRSGIACTPAKPLQ